MKNFEVIREEVIVTKYKWIIKCPKCGTIVDSECDIIEEILDGRCGGYGLSCPSCNFEQCITKEDLTGL